ncbi:hypothetical protein [Thalassotalea sediminis]|uniref:hypothetical protein n=1 Tax=Thalassotalea sediminis TaxID=1759089 RepID=UPI002573DACF|nr:hypothetical protein [Thalassotalea sediminis]
MNQFLIYIVVISSCLYSINSSAADLQTKINVESLALPKYLTAHDSHELKQAYIALMNSDAKLDGHDRELINAFERLPNFEWCNTALTMALFEEALSVLNSHNKTLLKKIAKDKIESDCLNIKLLNAIHADGEDKIFGIYEYISSAMSNKIDLVDAVKNKKYLTDEYTFLATKYYDNITYKALLQTYLVLNIRNYKKVIFDRNNLTISLYLLADSYLKNDDEYKYRMVMWSIVRELQNLGIIGEYSYRQDSEIKFH